MYVYNIHKLRISHNEQANPNYRRKLKIRTFDTGMEDSEAEPVKVVIYRREIVDIEVQQSAIRSAIGRARARREKPHWKWIESRKKKILVRELQARRHGEKP